MASVSRRAVLRAGAAIGGGLAAGALPDELLRHALAAGPRAAAACGQLGDIEHVVIFIQENRSFDNYFGTFPGVRGFDDRSQGAGIFSQRFDAALAPTIPNPMLPFHIDTAVNAGAPRPGECTNDVIHQWYGQHLTWNGGACDSWMSSHLKTDGAKDGPLTMGYYTRADLPLYHQLADNFTICDSYFCSVIAGTDINRLMCMTGTVDPDGWDGGLQFLDTRNPGDTKFTLGGAGKWIPYPQRLQDAGVTWKIYGTPDGQQGDNVLRYFPQFFPGQKADPNLAQNAFGSNAFPADFVADALAGRLPQVSWLLAGLADTEHPPGPLEWGQDITHTILTALFQSPQWARTALILTYDENGGFFDHVRPPTAPPGTPGEYLTGTLGAQAATDAGGLVAGQPIGLGFRVPTLVISPFARNPDPSSGPMVCSDRLDHTSILRFLERRFGVAIPDRDPATQTPGLSPWRRQAVGDLTGAFNFAAAPSTSTPALVMTNRADPRVLAECVVTLEPGTLAAQTAPVAEGYPVPSPPSMPTQEASRGPVKRPSGVCAVAVAASPSPTPATAPSPSPHPSPSAGSLPDSAAPTAAEDELPLGLALVGAGALLAGAWLARRRAAETAAGQRLARP